MDMIPEARIAYPVKGTAKEGGQRGGSTTWLLKREEAVMEDDNRVSYFFLGLGLGVAVGVLFAPKSGAETREFIRSKAGEGVDFVKKRGERLRNTATETIDRGKETMRRQKESLSAAVDAGKQAYREAVSNPSGGIRRGSDFTSMELALLIVMTVFVVGRGRCAGHASRHVE